LKNAVFSMDIDVFNIFYHIKRRLQC